LQNVVEIDWKPYADGQFNVSLGCPMKVQPNSNPVSMRPVFAAVNSDVVQLQLR
jgi:hypothetical protein